MQPQMLRAHNNLFLNDFSDHPKGHVSFASTHGKDCFTQTNIPEPRSKTEATLVQDLWPDHCVQGTRASQIAPARRREPRSHDLFLCFFIGWRIRSGRSIPSRCKSVEGGSDTKGWIRVVLQGSSWFSLIVVDIVAFSGFPSGYRLVQRFCGQRVSGFH